MAALSNHPDHCEVIDLAWHSAGHGPYLVRQQGYPPNTATFVSHPFVMQKDGSWLLNLAFAMLPEQEQERQLFQSLAKVVIFFEKLCTQPVKANANLPQHVDPAQVLANFEQCTQRILMGIKNGTVLPLSSARSKP